MLQKRLQFSMLSRSPILKLCLAVAINLGLVMICQRYWSISSTHIHQRFQLQQQEYFRQQLELLQAENSLKLKEIQMQQQEQIEKHHEALKSQLIPKLESETLYSFKVDETLHQTHDLAIPRDIPPWTEADTANLNTAIGFNLMLEVLKSEYSKGELITTKEELDFALASRAERLYKSLFNYVRPIYNSLPGPSFQDREDQLAKLAERRPEIDFFFRLEHKLYPFLHMNHRTAFSLQDFYKGRGLVLCAGNYQFEFVSTSIQAIRKLNKEIEIQVFHMGDQDLSQERQQYLQGMTNHIEVVDVTKILDNEYMQLGGWSIKAFSLLASRFEEVMLIDSDAFFLRDPAELFDDPGYKAMGTLYFYDRTLWWDWTWGPNWMRSMMPIMSTFPKTTRWFRGLSAHEQESGVIVINKKTRMNGLLAVCKMNSKHERDLWSYKVFYGDKETFWVGYEMVQEPYAFMKGYGGVVGQMRTDPRDDVVEKVEVVEGQEPPKEKPARKIIDQPAVCGAQLHTDYLGRPLWWNGGLMRNKNEGWREELSFEFWMDGGGRQRQRERFVRNGDLKRELLRDLRVSTLEELEREPEDPEWIFEESCLFGGEVHPLDDHQKDLTNSYIRVERVVKQVSSKIWAGEAVDPKEHDWASI
ncbi:hypothetical protein BGZ83_006883 [Gryganskiella cystojenkinii]|nr:hypothetical protein BGZ83_006883 [Gryganskiella cystojenkinii]